MVPLHQRRGNENYWDITTLFKIIIQIGVELQLVDLWWKGKRGEPLEKGGWKLPASYAGRRDYRLLSHVNRLTDNM